MLFDANAAFTLSSVQVYAGSAAMRTIELVSAVGVLQASRSVLRSGGCIKGDIWISTWNPGYNYRLMVSRNERTCGEATAVLLYPYQCRQRRNDHGIYFRIRLLLLLLRLGGGDRWWYPVKVSYPRVSSRSRSVRALLRPCRLRGSRCIPNPNNGQFIGLAPSARGYPRAAQLCLMRLGRQVFAENSTASKLETGYIRWILKGLPKGLYTLNIDLAGRALPAPGGGPVVRVIP